MFWHFLKVVYSRACESRGVWIKVRKLKPNSILKRFSAYAIMPLGKKKAPVLETQNEKPRERNSLGFSIPFFVRWLKP